MGAFLSKSSRVFSEGCPKMGLFRSRWVVMSLCPCMVVGRYGQVVYDCHRCCRCVELLPLASFSLDALSHSSRGRCLLTPPLGVTIR